MLEFVNSYFVPLLINYGLIDDLWLVNSALLLGNSWFRPRNLNPCGLACLSFSTALIFVRCILVQARRGKINLEWISYHAQSISYRLLLSIEENWKALPLCLLKVIIPLYKLLFGSVTPIQHRGGPVPAHPLLRAIPWRSFAWTLNGLSWKLFLVLLLLQWSNIRSHHTFSWRFNILSYWILVCVDSLLNVYLRNSWQLSWDLLPLSLHIDWC